MVRETPPRLNITTRDRFITRFRQQVRRRYIVTPSDRTVITRAAALCRVRPLRAYDAVQLACALVLRDDNLAAGQPAPTFVCADTTLLSFFFDEAPPTENPNDHP